jgi:hypothetical protein
MSTLRDRYLAWTATDVVGWMGKAQEDQHLDFKLLDKPDMGKDDLRHLAKSVSGFANADGGVIVWGVDARRDKADESIDQFVATPGVGNARKLLARLNELSSAATSPAVAGLAHRIIEGGAEHPDFVATHVPAGEGGPYMAMLDEAKHRYYLRIGSAFVPMDHSLVADMFGRRPHAMLNLTMFQFGSDPILGAELENTGRGVAVAPYLLFYDVRTPFMVAPLPVTGKVADFALPRTSPGSGDADGFVGGMNHVLHPGLRMRFRALQLSPTFGGGPAPTHCYASFRYGAVGVVERYGQLAFDFTRGRFERIDGAVGIPP